MTKANMRDDENNNSEIINHPTGETGIIKIGWFRELKHGDVQAGESIHKHLSEIAPQDREKITNYLDSGIVLAETLGTITYDELSEEKISIGPLRTLTDGKMIWPSDLAYYIRVYGVGIGSSAIKIMENNQWVVPSLSPEQLDFIDDSLFA